MVFGKELLCQYILCIFGWADSFEIKAVGQLKGWMWLELLECNWLKRLLVQIWHSSDNATNILGAILYIIARLSCAGRRPVDIARIVGVTKGAISKILKQVRQTGSLNERPHGHQQRISSPQEDWYLPRMMHANRFLPSSRLKAQLVCASLALPSVEKPSLCLWYRPLVWLYPHWRVKIQVASHSTQMEELGCVGGMVRGSLMSVCMEQMVMSAHLSLCGLDFAMAANLSWLCWTAPWTSKYTLGKSHLPEQLYPDPKFCSATQSLIH